MTAVALALAGVFSNHPHLDREVAVLLVLPVMLIYFAPTYTAVLRRHRRTGPIFGINLLLGWTIVGWVMSLVWACSRND